ncbi:MAG TPA: hypothetical protein VK021_07540 [Flavobacteriaceae bacterium]|nr:hypothetical protein [Flavobacteriaceae bacterium]
MEIKRFAAIDVGSNAVRLLINTVITTPDKPPRFKKISLVRVPIRLGQDVFVDGGISAENTERVQNTMKAFSLLMKAHQIDKYKACATSAMREADNGEALAEIIKENTGIKIDIIDGQQEAAIIAKTNLRELILSDKTYLYVDVGGGSTEFTLFSNGKTIASKSFKLGTVRILNDMVKPSLWEKAESWVKKETKKFKSIRMIGSGGNINHIFKHSGRKRGKPLTYTFLNNYNDYLNSLSYQDRVFELEMKLDRADVIIPATKIYLAAMEWSGSRKLYVPKIGLADGIIKSMYNQK